MARKYLDRCYVRWLPRRLHLAWHYPRLARQPASHAKTQFFTYSELPCKMTPKQWEAITKKGEELARKFGLTK